MHVFADLKPYLCTFEACDDHLTVFSSRKLWAEHEFNQHRRCTSYICYICSEALDNQQALLDHLGSRHAVSIQTQRQIQVVTSSAKTTEALPVETQKCPMCNATGWTTQRKFIKHVGGHMEDIALSTLPLEEDSETEDDDSEVSEAVTIQNPAALVPITAHGWNIHRDQITRLYRDMNLPLKEVQRIMTTDYNFKAT